MTYKEYLHTEIDKNSKEFSILQYSFFTGAAVGAILGCIITLTLIYAL